MKAKKRLKRALDAKRNFSSRGSKCPKCKADFRYGCEHSISEAHEVLDQRIFEARLAVIREKDTK